MYMAALLMFTGSGTPRIKSKSGNLELASGDTFPAPRWAVMVDPSDMLLYIAHR